eukprot:4183418-Ditylum_brightwellii.AAC.1
MKVKAGGTQKDNLKVSKHADLKVSQSKRHAKGDKQMAKLGVAKGRSYSCHILSNSSEYDPDKPIGNLKGKKNKRRKTLGRKVKLSVALFDALYEGKKY